MTEHVGPLRNRHGLERTLREIAALRSLDLPAPCSGLDPEWVDLHDLRNMALVAECVTQAALERVESRGAHQREDFPETSDAWQRHQVVRLGANGIQLAG
jgi:succinate dehydrogenase / fumarate reductase flavoprotein subunit